MTRSAKVEDINALKAFRVALVKFAEAANVALSDADSETRRVQGWVERDQTAHWQLQIRKRAELLARAEEALRMKQFYKQADGSFPSAFEEQKAVLTAKRRLQEAHEKYDHCRKWARKMDKEIQMYKGGVSRLVTAVAGDIPVALAKLDAMAAALERYVEYKPPAGGDAAGEVATSAGTTMARAEATPAAAGAPEGFPSLAVGRVAVLQRDRATGANVDAAGRPAQATYQAFDSADAARRYATQKVAELPQVECVLFDHQGRQLLAISVEGVS